MLNNVSISLGKYYARSAEPMVTSRLGPWLRMLYRHGTRTFYPAFSIKAYLTKEAPSFFVLIKFIYSYG